MHIYIYIYKGPVKMSSTWSKAGWDPPQTTICLLPLRATEHNKRKLRKTAKKTKHIYIYILSLCANNKLPIVSVRMGSVDLL